MSKENQCNQGNLCCKIKHKNICDMNIQQHKKIKYYAFFVYFIPLLMFFIGSILGNWIEKDMEIVSILLAFSMMGITFFVIKYKEKSLRKWIENL